MREVSSFSLPASSPRSTDLTPLGYSRFDSVGTIEAADEKPSPNEELKTNNEKLKTGFRNDDGIQPRRTWRVLHAANEVRPLIAVVESQLSAGMKPSVVTPAGLASPADFLKPNRIKPASLLFAWNDVRQWRRCLQEAEASAQPRGFELIHAHCFSAGMAGVRNWPAVVYNVTHFVEQQPSNDGSAEHSWLGRSFRVAEQFVLARAGAVVVHSEIAKRGVLERTAAEENVFQIPTPFSPGVLEELERTRLPRAGQSDAVSFFAPDLAASDPELEVVFQAFARVRAEGVQANLFLLALEKDAAPLLERAAALGIADAVHALPVSDAVHAYEFSDAVISQPPGATAADAEQDENSSAIQALLAGCALLAADGGRNRDLLDAGRGLVWYAPGDFRDLARRIALLTANPELRHSLAQSARRDLAAFRSPEAIGRMYQRVYHHAWQRRRIGGPGALPGATLEPLPQAS